MQAANALATGISWTVFMIPATIILAAGSMFILWLGERITDKGVGNGISLIIMIGIIARLPQAFVQEVTSRLQAISGGGLIMFIVEILILYAVVCASILWYKVHVRFLFSMLNAWLEISNMVVHVSTFL